MEKIFIMGKPECENNLRSTKTINQYYPGCRGNFQENMASVHIPKGPLWYLNLIFLIPGGDWEGGGVSPFVV